MCKGELLPEVLTFKQGAEFLGISTSKLEELVKQKDKFGKRIVPCSRIPPVKGSRGQRRFLKSELLHLLQTKWRKEEQTASE